MYNVFWNILVIPHEIENVWNVRRSTELDELCISIRQLPS